MSISRKLAALGTFGVSTLLVMGPTVHAYAAITCQKNSYYWAWQETNQGGHYGVQGKIAAPSATKLQGSSSNSDDSQHILNWIEQLNANPSGACGGGNSECWIQVGVGMGIVGSTVNGCNSVASNFTNSYQIYFEDIGAGGKTNCVDDFFPNIPISQDSAPWFSDVYDGSVGYTGQPQFATYVVDKNGNTDYINEGELYATNTRSEANSEIYTGSTTTCPTLSNSSPYVHFGTTIGGGTRDVSTELELVGSNGLPSDWTASSSHTDTPPYYLTGNGSRVDSFQTNGPASGAAKYVG